MTDHGETAAGTDLCETLGKRLYRAGYTEPRLGQLWGGAASDALVRNNAAPAVHRCRQVLVGGDAVDGAGTADGDSAADRVAAADRDLAALVLLFHFHQDVPAGAVRRALGTEAYAAGLAAGLIELGGSGADPGDGAAAPAGEGAAALAHNDGAAPADDDGAVVTAPFAITPYDLPVGVPRGFRPGDENLYLISDHGTLVDPDVLDGDFVLGLGGAGRTLVSLTPRDRVGLAADIGTGCGIQALLLARHSDRVIATDISTRALRLAELSARLNGVDTIDFRLGSLLEPLSERVDLLVSNPPFVITPRTVESDSRAGSALPDFEYRDGGMTGDALVRSLFTAIPEVLRPGGRSVCLGNWELTSGQDASGAAAGRQADPAAGDRPTGPDGSDDWQPARTGPAAWVTDPDISVLVIERETLDPIAYAETWIRDGGVSRASRQWNQATAAWMDDFASRHVTGVVFGYVLMQRIDEQSPDEQGIDNDSPTFDDSAACPAAGASPDSDRSRTFKTNVRITSAPASNAHGIGSFVQTIFELRSWLAGVDAEELADMAFTRSPDLVEHRHFIPGNPDPTTITLEQGIGFGQVFDLDTALAGFVSVADGTLTLRQTAAALAQLLEVDALALEDQLIAQVRQLAAAGFLLPAEREEATSD